MIERMTHEEFVLSARETAVQIAPAILGGELPVLDGCHALAALRAEAGVEEHDPDFQVFAVISSETDALPMGPVKAQWAAAALARLGPEMQSATAWATPQAFAACQSVVHRFGAQLINQADR